jgi:hypothetical protein
LTLLILLYCSKIACNAESIFNPDFWYQL